MRLTLQNNCPYAFNKCADSWVPGSTAEKDPGCLDAMVEIYRLDTAVSEVWREIPGTGQRQCYSDRLATV